MLPSRGNFLITGTPGVGKTTLIKQLAGSLRDLNPVGFYTEEIREHGVRRGFRLVDFEGRESILAHINVHGEYRVGKYGVDVARLESFLHSLDFGRAPIVIIDEIGRMECYSAPFRQLVMRLLDSPQIFVAAIALKGTGFIAQVKDRPDCILDHVTVGNRDRLAGEVADRIRRWC